MRAWDINILAHGNGLAMKGVYKFNNETPAQLDRIKDRLCALGLAVFPVMVFLKAALGFEVLGKYDTIFQFLPMRILLGNYIRHLQLPLWNPYMVSGTPFLADVQMAVLYPLNWLFAILPFSFAHNWIIIFHHSMAAVATFYFARFNYISRTGALAAALIFSFSTFMIGYHSALNVTLASSWLPVILLCLDRLKTRFKFKNFLLLSLSVSMMIYAGYPQVALYIMAMALTYAAFSAAVFTPRGGRFRFLMASISALFLGLMLALPQIIPSYELAVNSFRTRLSYEQFTLASIPPLDQLVSTLSEYLFLLRRAIKTSPEAVLGFNLGPFLILLIAFALIKYRPRKAIWFWTIIFGLATLLSMGKYIPIYRLFFLIPIYNMFRGPSRLAVLAIFASSILAGYGLSALEKTGSQQALKTRLSPSAKLAATALALSFGFIFIINLGYADKLKDAVFNPYLGQLAFSQNLLLFLAFLTAALIMAETALFLILRRYSGLRTIKTLAVYAVAIKFAGLGGALRFSTDAAYLEGVYYGSKPASVQTLLNAGTAEKGFRVSSISHESIYKYNPQAQHIIYTSLAFPTTSAVYAVQSTEIYGPFMLPRYGKLIGATSLAFSEGGFHDDYDIYAEGSSVLEILGVKYITSLKKEIANPPILTRINGIGFEKNMRLGLKSGESYTFMALSIEAKEIAIISTIGGGGNLRQGEAFALAEAELAGGEIVKRELLAGIDSADWDIDRPSPAKSTLHGRAPVAEDYPSPPEIAPAYSNHSYFSLFTLDQPARIKNLKISYTAKEGTLWVFKISIVDTNGSSQPLSKTYSDLSLNPAFSKIYDDGSVLIYENKAALPRAWLVQEVIRVNPGESEEILRSGKFRDGSRFDPSKVALVEEFDEELSRLRPAPLRGDEIVGLEKFSPNSLEIQAKPSAPRLLVASEIFYPGWLAYVDGKRAKIHRVNSVLRGVVLGEGSHKVVFKYRPKSLYAGLALFGAAIAMLTAAKRLFF